MKDNETTGEPGFDGKSDEQPGTDAPPPQQEAPAPNPLQVEIDGLRDKLRATETRLREVSKAYRDLEGDMDAFRKRAQSLADQRADRRAGEVVEQFFEPVRNLRRSMAASGSDSAAVIEGLRMIAQQFDDTMARLGLQELPGVGSSFDPSIHEALAIQPVTDAAQDNKVIFVHAAGYRLGGKVLQPAQVVIGKFGEAAPEA